MAARQRPADLADQVPWLVHAARRARSWHVVYVGERAAQLTLRARLALRWRPDGHTPTVTGGTATGMVALVAAVLARMAWRYLAWTVATLGWWLWCRTRGTPVRAAGLPLAPRRWVLLVLGTDLPLAWVWPALWLLETRGRTVGVHVHVTAPADHHPVPVPVPAAVDTATAAAARRRLAAGRPHRRGHPDRGRIRNQTAARRPRPAEEVSSPGGPSKPRT